MKSRIFEIFLQHFKLPIFGLPMFCFDDSPNLMIHCRSNRLKCHVNAGFSGRDQAWRQTDVSCKANNIVSGCLYWNSNLEIVQNLENFVNIDMLLFFKIFQNSQMCTMYSQTFGLHHICMKNRSPPPHPHHPGPRNPLRELMTTADDF